MLDTKTQLITYVGKKLIKTDTVAGTGIIWNGYGDTQEVMHVAAVKLIQHPDVWITKEKFDALGKNTPKAQAAKPAEVKSEEAEEANPEEISEPGLSSADNAEENKAPEQLTGISTEPNARHSTIKAALVSMDADNEEHFSKQTGNPIIAAVREVAGDKTISLKEVNAAWSELKGANK